MRLRVVAMPLTMLAHGALANSQRCGVVARADAGSTAIGLALLHGVYAQMTRLSLVEQPRVARVVVDMLDMLAGVALAAAESDAPRSRAAHLTRVMAYVREHLAEPDLDAQAIGQALRISPRYVRVLLRARGMTLRALLLEQRLARCRDDLLDPLYRHRSASDIAYAWGFNSPSHFSRVFRARYGVAPACFRRQQGS